MTVVGPPPVAQPIASRMNSAPCRITATLLLTSSIKLMVSPVAMPPSAKKVSHHQPLPWRFPSRCLVFLAFFRTMLLRISPL